MLYVKSILAGLVTLFLSALLFIAIQLFRLLRIAREEMGMTGGEVGIDVISLFKSPRSWIVALIAFAVGFWWQFRRAS
jgi:hypothetical protein